MSKTVKEKQKETEAKLKELRRELEEKLEEQLPPEMLEERTRSERNDVENAAEEGEISFERAKQIIEAVLFASSRPVTMNEMRRILKSLKNHDIERVIQSLQEDYLNSQRSFEIREIAGGYEIMTRKEFAPWVFKLEVQKRAKQATQSALETLAILAYKQPVTKAEIEDLRGVDVGGVINTLAARGLIKIVGKKEVPGRPFLYGTTDKFLEHFGLKNLTDLPNIQEIKHLVENSVKREELLGRPQMVDIPEENGSSETSSEDESETQVMSEDENQNEELQETHESSADPKEN